jgi:hypothetical protein
MAITTYSELQTAIASWLNRSDLTVQVPDFIALAETRINRDLRAREQQVIATANVDTAFFALPGDFLEFKSFRITDVGGSAFELMLATPEQISAALAENSVSNTPRFVTIIGDQFQLWPAPDQMYVGSLAYVRKVPALSVAAPTNWLLTDAPDVYLYGALMAAGPFLRDNEALVTFKALFDEALEGIRVANKPVVGVLRTEFPQRGLQRRYSIYSDF